MLINLYGVYLFAILFYSRCTDGIVDFCLCVTLLVFSLNEHVSSIQMCKFCTTFDISITAYFSTKTAKFLYSIPELSAYTNAKLWAFPIYRLITSFDWSFSHLPHIHYLIHSNFMRKWREKWKEQNIQGRRKTWNKKLKTHSQLTNDVRKQFDGKSTFLAKYANWPDIYQMNVCYDWQI